MRKGEQENTAAAGNIKIGEERTEQQQGILREEKEGRVAAGNIEKRGTGRQSSGREYKEKGRTREHSSSRNIKRRNRET